MSDHGGLFQGKMFGKKRVGGALEHVVELTALVAQMNFFEKALI